MARPRKRGLDFYSLDTNVFSNRKIRRLLKNFGANGYLIYSYVLTEIYRDKGCFIVWDEDTAFDVSDYLNLKETVVSEVINYCCNVGLFNKELRTSGGILTSKNIQEFWVSVSKKAKRTDITISEAFNLISEETTSNEEETTSNEEETTQSKVKERKVNKSKIKESTPKPPQGADTSFKKNEDALNSEKIKKEKKVPPKKTKRFEPPSLQKVQEYCKERNNGVDAWRWYNFYQAKDWFIGKNKMKDWRAAVRTWEKPKLNATNPITKPKLNATNPNRK